MFSTRKKRNTDPIVQVKGVPVNLGDSRKDVLGHMGVPNAISAGGGSETHGGESATLIMPSGNKIPGPDLSKDPSLLTATYWKYYGYGSKHNFAAIHFDGNKVVAIRYEQTIRPMRTPYD